MSKNNESNLNTRILVCDDNEAIHKDFLKVLNTAADKKHQIDYLEEQLFEDEVDELGQRFTDPYQEIHFKIDSAYQGQDGLQMAEKAAAEGEPYSIIFMDVRMPPGWDGVLTAEKIWEKFPFTEIVIVTAYSDYTWDDMIDKLGFNTRLLFIKKPFDTLTVKQLALNLINKWNTREQARKQLTQLKTDVEDSTPSSSNLVIDDFQTLSDTIDKI